MEFITDRNQVHVYVLKNLLSKGWENLTSYEREQFENYATRGAYNYTDMNRVEAGVALASDMLGLGLTTKTDWTQNSVPTYDEMQRYIGNVAAILEAHKRIEVNLIPQMVLPSGRSTLDGIPNDAFFDGQPMVLYLDGVRYESTGVHDGSLYRSSFHNEDDWRRPSVGMVQMTASVTYLTIDTPGDEHTVSLFYRSNRTLESIQLPITMSRLHYISANNIERVLDYAINGELPVPTRLADSSGELLITSDGYYLTAIGL